MPPALAWAVTAALALAGAAGVFLPVIPGAVLILAAAVFNKVMLPAALSWWTVGGLCALCLLGEGSSLLTLAGARKLGATRWGMAGAVVGALLCLFGGVVGIAAGAAVGALAGEVVFAGRSVDEAAKAAVGASLGIFASAAGRILVSVTMLLWLLTASLRVLL
ncbi:MAG: DUF456 domain-containing protein [Elusimicrobia bacterium]|nr:DUF456 domain-containing protein [Elusimicrobiota bacterium]